MGLPIELKEARNKGAFLGLVVALLTVITMYYTALHEGIPFPTNKVFITLVIAYSLIIVYVSSYFAMLVKFYKKPQLMKEVKPLMFIITLVAFAVLIGSYLLSLAMINSYITNCWEYQLMISCDELLVFAIGQVPGIIFIQIIAIISGIILLKTKLEIFRR